MTKQLAIKSKDVVKTSEGRQGVKGEQKRRCMTVSNTSGRIPNHACLIFKHLI